MSIFKSKGVILKKISSPGNSDIIYSIFSLYYGKIQARAKISKKEKTLDLGNLIDFEIETSDKSKINKIKNIKISSIFLYEGKEYKIIEQYLKIINTVIKLTPDGVAIDKIFEILKAINSKEDLNYSKLVLAELKIINILGILNLENKNPLIQKILLFVDKNNIETIFLLEKLDDEILEKLSHLK